MRPGRELFTGHAFIAKAVMKTLNITVLPGATGSLLDVTTFAPAPGFSWVTQIHLRGLEARIAVDFELAPARSRPDAPKPSRRFAPARLPHVVESWSKSPPDKNGPIGLPHTWISNWRARHCRCRSGVRWLSTDICSCCSPPSGRRHRTVCRPESCNARRRCRTQRFSGV